MKARRAAPPSTDLEVGYPLDDFSDSGVDSDDELLAAAVAGYSLWRGVAVLGCGVGACLLLLLLWKGALQA